MYLTSSVGGRVTISATMNVGLSVGSLVTGFEFIKGSERY